MKKTFFYHFKLASLMLALFSMVFMTSCDPDDDDDDDPTTLVEDGLYIKGDAVAYDDFSIKAALQKTRNEVLQEDRSDLLEIYIAVKGTGGFNLVDVAGETQTTYGPSSDFGNVDGTERDQPKITYQRGTAEETESTFSVPSDGLYHVVMDKELKTVAIIPVEYWGIIGGATPNGWSDDTRMESMGFDMTSMTFKAEQVPLTLGDFKFRYSGGWKVEIDTTYDLGDGNTGIKVNANYGGAVDALVPGGDNITNSESGFYDVMMVWTDGEGYAATMTRTGDLPSKDWSDIELGLVGDGLVFDGAKHNWDNTAMLKTPAVNGSVFTWDFENITVATDGGGFKIRQGNDWSNAIIGFNDVVLLGDGADDFETNGDGNFVPLVDGASYSLSLQIDGSTEAQNLTITKL